MKINPGRSGRRRERRRLSGRRREGKKRKTIINVRTPR